jgi:hypothetical protein
VISLENANELVEPTDLGVHIGTKKEVWLTKVRTALVEELEMCEHTADLNREFIAVLDKKILTERETFK